MKITNYKYFDLIKIENYVPETIVVENPVYYRNMVEEIIDEFNNDTGDFIISNDGEKPLVFSKNCMVINDFFNSDINNKSFKTKLLSTIVANYHHLLDDSDIMLKLNELAIEISNSFPFDISYNSMIAFSDVVKMLDFKFDIEEGSFWDRFLERIIICKEMLSYELIVTINLKDIISKAEYDELIKNLKYRQISMLMIERNTHANLDNPEHTLIIDEDMCVI